MMITKNQDETRAPGALKRSDSQDILPKRILVGYWHNWQDQAAFYVRLKNISPKFDVVNVAFATSSAKTPGLMTFTPCEATTPAQFKEDIACLHSQGKKVVLSIGGANHPLALGDARARDHFVESTSAIIRAYDFDGMDINLERQLSLGSGDCDFRNSASLPIVHLIEAIRRIRSNFDAGFILSMAPETISVQGGLTDYNGEQGSYLPVIHGVRDILTYVHVQHYNSAAMVALDGHRYTQGTADFHVAMAEMLLQGFPINRDQDRLFPMLRPEQILIGLPALPHAASNGYTDPLETRKALDYLIKGQPFGGRYQLRQPGGYPAFRGVMTWSINWDAANFQHFSRSTRAYLDALA